MKAVIVIPVYKLYMSEDELCSFQRCLHVLSQHDIYLVCPEGMNVQTYKAIAGDALHTTSFPAAFFKGIEGYNELLKSHSFYERFMQYDYMLIYQLDAWVFEDKLYEWCQKGYDYVGSPWFEHEGEGQTWSALKKNENGEYSLWRTGNGGLSLRHIPTFLHVTKRWQKMVSFHDIFKNEYHSAKDLPHCLMRCLGPLIGTNSMRHYIDSHTQHIWEDAFFCIALEGTRFQLNIPTPEDAAFFSFECQPSYLFEHITHGQLPFGCHAWRRYQYDEFWRNYIPQGN